MVPSPQSECAICMVELCGTSGQGCPNNHTFHVVCILEWLKRERSCPLCREHISCLTVNEAGCGRSLIELPPTPPGSPANDEIENMLCEVCHSGDDEAHLLLCDRCDKCFHMRCLRPPLSTIPEGYWYCPPCERERALEHLQSSSSSRTRRQITRTALSQNVRTSLRSIVNPHGEESEESSEDDYETEDESNSEEETENNNGQVEFSNDEAQDDFVLDAVDQPGPSRQPPRVPTRRTRGSTKRARKSGKRGKRTRKRRKARKSTRKSTRKRTSQRTTNGYNAIQKRIAEVTNVNLKSSTCYNVQSLSEKARCRAGPLGGTLNILKPGIDEYISESESDSDDCELSSNARRFDRPVMRPPRKRQEPMQENFASQQKAVQHGLLDEILENQTKMLAPSNFLKIRRDGTLEERKEMKEYRKRIQDKLSNHPAFKPRRERPIKPDASNMSFQNDNPSTSLLNTSVISNGNSPKKTRWGPAQPRTPTTRNDLNGCSSGSPLSASRVPVLQPRTPMFSTQMQRNAALLPLQPFLSTVSLADVVNAPPPPPPPVLPQGNNGNSVFTLQHQLMSQMFSPMLPSTANTGGIDPALLGMLSGAPATVPFTVANLNAIPMPVAPPPPPPLSHAPTISKSGPLRTNDDSLAEMDISPQTSGRDNIEQKHENGNSEEGDKARLRNDADKEMKKALIPYFRNKKITKEEYKTLMKRGVYKLVKRGRPITTEAATKLAMNYVFELSDSR
ncbi:hypothetical protein QR680_001753 [Steinernema hermaphroditum]|uniref:PHD-type domain-containing protein n=1 Tax=Steinernema hermaphroditum TaxID=289476 RepID=A0AA39LGT4_9BILA|nr:hypothetical protein QR680_001753 [Steinernema hermaphroditum]